MLNITLEAELKPFFLFCHCGPKEGKQCHRVLLLEMIGDIAKEEGLNVEIQI